MQALVRCGYPSACPYRLTEQRHCGACDNPPSLHRVAVLGDTDGDGYGNAVITTRLASTPKALMYIDALVDGDRDLIVRDLNNDGHDDVGAFRISSALRLLGSATGLSLAPCDH